MIVASVLAALLSAAAAASAQTESPAPAASTAVSPAVQAPRAKVRETCAADIRTYCADVQPGQGGMMRCLRENAAKMSDPCKAALVDLRAARGAPAPPG